MPKVIKVLASKTNGIDIYADDGKIYPFTYLPNCLQEYIYSVEAGEDDLHAWDEEELNNSHHLEVAEAEDMEILYEAEE